MISPPCAHCVFATCARPTDASRWFVSHVSTTPFAKHAAAEEHLDGVFLWVWWCGIATGLHQLRPWPCLVRLPEASFINPASIGG